MLLSLLFMVVLMSWNNFVIVFSFESEVFKNTDKRNNEMMGIRVAKENCFFFHKIWGKRNRKWNMLPNPNRWVSRCNGVFEAFFLHAHRFKVEYSQVFEKFLLISVLNSKRVLLVKESFLGLIYVLWIDNTHSFTACC